MRPIDVRMPVAAATAAMCVMAVGCGAVRSPAHAPGTVSRAHAQTGALSPEGTAAGNRAAALAEAVRLLSLVWVPPGAVPVASPPRSLRGPPIGTPLVSSLVDRVLAWQVRLPFTAVRAWLAAPPPRGLTADGSASAKNTVTGQTTTSGTSSRYRAAPAPRPTGSHCTESALLGDGNARIRQSGGKAKKSPISSVGRKI